MINRTIIKIDAADIRIGKVCPWNDGLLVFDVAGGRMLQLSGSGETIQQQSLKEIANINRIDTVFIDEENLVIADSLGKTLYRMTAAAGEDGKLTFGAVNEFPQAAGTIIVAAASVGEHYWLLDKGKCLIRVCDKDFKEIKTIGSRMGYIYEYDEDTMPRLGFEFPEDMAWEGERIVVSDSGNKRLVVLNPEGKQLDVIKLPEFPYKIISMDGDRVVVSDFDRTLIVVSLRYGYVYKEEIGYPVDFFPSVYHRSRHVVGSESKELVELTIDDTPQEALAEKAANHVVTMKIKVDKKEIPEARKLVERYPELLPEYVAYYYDETETVAAQLTGYINETVEASFKENENLKTEITAQSLEFVKKYKAIPDSEDEEAAHIEKEHVRHQLFLTIKKFRRNLYQVASLKQKINKYSTVREVLDGVLDRRFEILKHRLPEAVRRVEEHLEPLNDRELLDAIVQYWLLEEEERVMFTARGFRYQELFHGQFLLSILKDFNFSIASLYLKRNKIDQYITFCDREITMFPDKMGVFNSFVNTLLEMRKYDDVLRMLEKFPDKNKENVNYYLYRISLEQGDTDKAFTHLKKELELYSHRVNLVPELIRLNKLSPEETQRYIDDILEKTGQAIDGYYHVAEAYISIGDYSKAERYTDRELALFPENVNALRLKYKLFFRQPSEPREPGYFKRSWEQFSRFMEINRNETILATIIPLFTALNYFSCGNDEIEKIEALAQRATMSAYREELSAYLSFRKHYTVAPVAAVVEKYELDQYLSSYSTGRLARNHFFEEAKEYKDAGEWEKHFDLIEKILKYNPGDEEIFRYLDEILGEGNHS